MFPGRTVGKGGPVGAGSASPGILQWEVAPGRRAIGVIAEITRPFIGKKNAERLDRGHKALKKAVSPYGFVEERASELVRNTGQEAGRSANKIVTYVKERPFEAVMIIAAGATTCIVLADLGTVLVTTEIATASGTTSVVIFQAHTSSSDSRRTRHLLTIKRQKPGARRRPIPRMGSDQAGRRLQASRSTLTRIGKSRRSIRTSSAMDSLISAPLRLRRGNTGYHSMAP